MKNSRLFFEGGRIRLKIRKQVEGIFGWVETAGAYNNNAEV
ncbi:MAG: hypothetical protein ACYC37_05265 [Desulfobacteria bacterium]